MQSLDSSGGMNRARGTSGVTDESGDPKVPSCAASVTWRPEAFGLLLHDWRTDALYEGNHAALELLRAAEQGVTVRQASHRIAALFGISEQRARRDAVELLAFLRSEGLLGESV